MEELRKSHNLFKRELIQKCVKRKDYVLDCGCGRGGDLHKWKGVGCNLVCVDPDASSLDEARERAKTLGIDATFIQGDIRTVKGEFDVICYNFSLHYIAATPQLFKESVDALVDKVKRGGVLIGIVPDPNRLPCEYFRDRLGNTVVREGETLRVKLVDGPFYSGQERIEPILHPENLKRIFKSFFECIDWSPMCQDTGLISDIYSKFIFRRNSRWTDGP
jgi:ubiquinone/menaquinone biosynthesis C-methylase UbiE